MKVSLLTLHCLNAMADDRENVAAIVADVRASAHGDVSAADISACMNELLAEGVVSRSTDQSGTDWFQLTPKGRQELEANWVDE
ncbi:MAG: hypothetical protein ACKOYJ_00595 [Planctomycetia bacterium]